MADITVETCSWEYNMYSRTIKQRSVALIQRVVMGRQFVAEWPVPVLHMHVKCDLWFTVMIIAISTHFSCKALKCQIFT